MSGDEPVGGDFGSDGLWLKPGRYTLDLYLCTPSGIIDLFERRRNFEVSPILPYPQSSSPESTAAALVLADFAWKLDRPREKTRCATRPMAWLRRGPPRSPSPPSPIPARYAEHSMLFSADELAAPT